MEKTQNTNAEAIAIFNRALHIIEKQAGGPVTVMLYDGDVHSGKIKTTAFFSNTQVPNEALPHRGSVELADDKGKETSFDIFLIRSLELVG